MRKKERIARGERRESSEENGTLPIWILPTESDAGKRRGSSFLLGIFTDNDYKAIICKIIESLFGMCTKKRQSYR
jgi:hypothetical protein